MEISQYTPPGFGQHPQHPQHPPHPGQPAPGAPYAALANGHSQQQSPAHDQPTLPPLQPQLSHNYSHLPPMYGAPSSTASPHPPHTPGANSASSHNTPAFSHMTAPSPSAGAMAPPPTSYMSAPSAYSTAHPNHPQPNMTRAMPPNGHFSGPMPPGTPLTPFPSFQSPGAMPGQPPHPYMPGQEMDPAYMVGAQGRRGVLPSVPGRAPIGTPPAAAGPPRPLIPPKDKDGKFPCPQCHKSYLHAKHLKRHLLRHTGDRPYSCHICNDTFSRSDILKRHFQKCSIRRGNPSGQNHLHGNRRGTASSAHRMSVGSGDLSALSDSTASYSKTASPTVNGDHSYASSIASMSARSSRANSLIQPANGYHGLGVPGMSTAVSGPDGHPVTPSAYGNPSLPFHMRPHSASNPVHPSSYGFGVPPGSAGHGGNYTASPASGQPTRGPSQSVDWGHMFNAHEQDGFMHGSQQDPQQQAPRTEQNTDGPAPYNGSDPYNERFLNGMHSHQSQDFSHEEGAHLMSR